LHEPRYFGVRPGTIAVRSACYFRVASLCPPRPFFVRDIAPNFVSSTLNRFGAAQITNS
jgi:hypothetical protein